MNPISSPAIPDTRALLDEEARRQAYALNCHEVGEVVSYDAAKQTATVQIMVLRVLGQRRVKYPLLTDCPVFFPFGGTARLTMPVAAGDSCLVLFNDRDLDNWFTSGANVEPNTGRAHDLSDGMVLVGFRNLQNKQDGYSATDTELINGDGVVGIGPESKISLRNETGSVRQRLEDLVAGLDTTHDGLDSLCSALTSWVDTAGHSPNPATVSAINSAKSTIAAGKSAIDQAKTAIDAILK